MRQEHRERLLGVTRDQIQSVAHKYLGLPLQQGKTSKVIFGTDKVNAKELRDAGWKVQQPIEILAKNQ